MQTPVVRISDNRKGIIVAALYSLTVLLLLLFITFTEPDPPKITESIPIVIGDEGFIDFEISSSEGGGSPNETASTDISNTSKEQDTQEESSHQVVKGSDNSNDIAASNKKTDLFSGGNSGDSNSSEDGSKFGPDVGGGGDDNKSGGGTIGPDRIRLSNISSKPQTHNDEIVYIALKLTVNSEGTVLRAECIRKETSTTNQLLIDEVIKLAEKEVKYKAKPGVDNQTAYYTIKVSPGGSVSFN